MAGPSGWSSRTTSCTSAGPAARWLCIGVAFLAAATLTGCDDNNDGTPRAIEAVDTFGGPGDTPGRFIKPRAIDTDGQTLWVADRSGRIQRLDPQTGACLQWLNLPTTQNGYPTGLTVAPSPAGDGQPCLYVADTHYHRIIVYAIPPVPSQSPGPNARPPGPEAFTPQVIMQFGEYGNDPGQFIYPTDIAVLLAPDEKTVTRIYVTEYGGNDRVQAFDASGKPLFAFGSPGPAQDDTVTFDRPQSIVIDRDHGELVVTDSIHHRIGRFTLDGKLVRWLGKPGTAPGAFQHPRGLNLLGDGTALTVEFGNNRVQRFNLDTGQCLATWGRPGRGPGELAEPWSLAMLGGRTFIVDAMNHRIVVMRTPR